MTRILIASANPYAFCIAVERHLARTLGEKATVDGLNLYSLASRRAPYFKSRPKQITEAINRKFDRFVRPVLNGRDITADIKIDGSNIPPLPQTVEDLLGYRSEGAAVGVGVISSMVSLTTLQARYTEEYGPRALDSWHAAHLSLRAGLAVRGMGYDEVYVFNGRQCYVRPFREVLEQSTKVMKYEVGGNEDTTTYVASTGTVHDPDAFAEIIGSHTISLEEGEAFYRDRLTRAAGNEVNYLIGIQDAGSFPPELAGQDYVAYFSSSADERLAAYGEYRLGGFSNQNELALALADLCREKGQRFVVRLHPHLRYKHPAWRDEWDFGLLRQRGAILVMPEETWDSYAIAANAKAVISGGSTISFECTYLGVPNAVVGYSLPAALGSSLLCDNKEELRTFIADPKLAPAARLAALTYGSYMRVGGIPIPNYDLRGNVCRARLENRTIDPVRNVLHRTKTAVRSLFA